MFLGSDAVLLDGMELGSQPTGLRLPDLQPVAGPPAASGPPRAQPPHLANKPPPAPRRRPGDHLPPAVLRLLHALGAHGTDAEPGGESPPPSVGQSPPPTARRPVPRCRARPHLAQLPQCRAGNRLKTRVPSIFQSLFGWPLSQVFTGRMISVGTPSASYRTLWSGSGVALRRIRRTPFWSVGRTIVAIS